MKKPISSLLAFVMVLSLSTTALAASSLPFTDSDYLREDFGAKDYKDYVSISIDEKGVDFPSGTLVIESESVHMGGRRNIDSNSKVANIPDTVVIFGISAFMGRGLGSKSVDFSKYTNLKLIDDFAFSSNDLYYADLRATKVVRIGNTAFAGNRSMNLFIASPTLKRIDDSAFESCRITKFELNEGLEYLGYLGLDFNAENIYLPSTLTYISDLNAEKSWRTGGSILTFRVIKGTYAEEWCKRVGATYTLEDPATYMPSLGLSRPPVAPAKPVTSGDIKIMSGEYLQYTMPGVLSTETVPVDRGSVYDSATAEDVYWVFSSATAKGITVYTVPVGTDIRIAGLDSCFVADVHLKDGVLKYIDNSGFGLASALDTNFEWDANNSDVFSKNAHVKFLKVGYYAFRASGPTSSSINDCVIRVVGENKITATPTSSKVLVNGNQVNFDAYTINGNNYFKLRDIAKVISGSGKQFEVIWNGEKNAIELLSGKAYTVAGGELAKGDGTAKNAVDCKSTIFKDGVAVDLKAYTINGNNYFKLRDLGQAFDFGVSWDGTNNAVVIDTAQGYRAE